MSVNRTELVAQIAERADLTKAKADEALAAFQAVLVESLAKGEAGVGGAVRVWTVGGGESVCQPVRARRDGWSRGGDPLPKNVPVATHLSSAELQPLGKFE